MQQYQELVRKILAEGHVKTDRTGVGTKSLFGYQMRFDLSQGFPMVTTKRVPFGLIKSELLWFLRGDTNVRYLLEHNNHIWDEWAFKRYVESPDYHGPDMTDFGLRAVADPDFNEIYQQELAAFNERVLTDDDFAERYGNLGNVYGAQWRSWPLRNGETLDQISHLVDMIKHSPDSRRLIVSAWNPEDVPSMALPPCHTLFQFYVHDGKLSCQLYQRSADVSLGDAHLYLNHLEAAETLLSREPKPLPQLEIDDFEQFDQVSTDQIRLQAYEPWPTIKAPIAV